MEIWQDAHECIGPSSEFCNRTNSTSRTSHQLPRKEMELRSSDNEDEMNVTANLWRQSVRPMSKKLSSSLKAAPLRFPVLAGCLHCLCSFVVWILYLR